ncbi:U5 small nuclear ribonucleoprotein 40 kDa protein [Spathaspora sp. JA1]|nr:U5 small nuclear ribonucleoprotein 40 kDa protein [Spathaspora sp. JA1]
MSIVKKQRKSIDDPSIKAIPGRSRILYSPTVVLENGHQGTVYCTKFNHDGTKIASGGHDKTIQLWNLPTSVDDPDPNYLELVGHKGAVLSISWSLDDCTLVSASADSTIGFWDVFTGRRLRKCIGHERVINQVVASSDHVISVGDDGKTFFWDIRDKDPVASITTNFPLLSCAVNNKGNTVYTTGIDPTINAYDVRVLDKPLWTVDNSNSAPITSLAISKDDTMLLSHAMNGTIVTYNANDIVPKSIPRTNPHAYTGAPSGKENLLIGACFSNDNIRIISGSEDACVTEWDLASREIIGKYSGHEGAVLDVDYHSDEKIIVSCSTDSRVIVREI